MNRRNFLASLVACPFTAASAQEWNYRENGPERWGSLDRSFSVCGVGDQQSPIDLRDGIKTALPKITIHVPGAPVTVGNNGHTIQVTTPEGASLVIGATEFPLSQFHFHAPSEHSIEGKQAAMEVHFVFSHRDAQLTVVAALLVPGRRNPAFSEIMSIAPERLNAKSQTATSIDARQLLPARIGDTWRYEGSLTTPPCSQTVDWIVFNNLVEVADADIERFRNIFPVDARPRQPLNRRFVRRG